MSQVAVSPEDLLAALTDLREAQQGVAEESQRITASLRAIEARVERLEGRA